MPQMLVYKDGDELAVSCLAKDVRPEDVVPSGVPYRMVSSESLPDAAYRDAWTADFEAADFAVTIDPVAKADIDKRLEAEAIEAWFAEAIQEGFNASDSIRLGLRPEDVTLLTGNFVLAREAAALGMDVPPLIDRNGTAHPMESIEQLTGIMLAYGQYRAALSAEYASRKAALGE